MNEWAEGQRVGVATSPATSPGHVARRRRQALTSPLREGGLYRAEKGRKELLTSNLLREVRPY